MKLGFITQPDLAGIAADCRFAVEHGFVGLEMMYWADFKDLSDATVQQIRATLLEHQVECSTFGLWGWNPLAVNPDERVECHRQLTRAIDYAAGLGAPVLISSAGHSEGNSVAQDVDLFAEVMRPFIDRINAAGMKLALYGFHSGSFLQTLADYEQLWSVVDDVYFKYDPANIDHICEDYLAVPRDHGQRIAHVHIKEHLYHRDELASEPPAGMGDIQWGKVMAFLYECDYQGYLTIEPHGPLWSREPLRSKMLLLSQRHIAQYLI